LNLEISNFISAKKMNTLPEYFGIFRPGYGVHTHLVLVKNTQRNRNGNLTNSIDFVSIEGGRFIESDVEKTDYKMANVSGENNVSYKFLPFNVVTSNNTRYPIIFFKTTGFIHTPALETMKYMLSHQQINTIKSKMIHYNVVDNVINNILEIDDDIIDDDIIDDDYETPTPPISTPSTSIPTFVIQNHLENERNKNVNCPITLKPLKECDTLSVLSCFHIFDKESIIEYRIINNRCPICRVEATIIHNEKF